MEALMLQLEETVETHLRDTSSSLADFSLTIERITPAQFESFRDADDDLDD
jgi:hypothetical protein